MPIFENLKCYNTPPYLGVVSAACLAAQPAVVPLDVDGAQLIYIKGSGLVVVGGLRLNSIHF